MFTTVGILKVSKLGSMDGPCAELEPGTPKPLIPEEVLPLHGTTWFPFFSDASDFSFTHSAV